MYNKLHMPQWEWPIYTLPRKKKKLSPKTWKSGNQFVYVDVCADDVIEILAIICHNFILKIPSTSHPSG